MASWERTIQELECPAATCKVLGTFEEISTRSQAAAQVELEASPSFMPATPTGQPMKRGRNRGKAVKPAAHEPREEEEDNGDGGDDGEQDEEGGEAGREVKRPRLTPGQIHLLEQSFQEESNPEPQRKRLLARQLGIRLRQVAVWFQNRRVRLKTKQLEAAYERLRAEYQSVAAQCQAVQADYELLKCDYSDLLTENTQLCQQLVQLTSRPAPMVAAGGSAVPQDPITGQIQEAQVPVHGFQSTSSHATCQGSVDAEAQVAPLAGLLEVELLDGPAAGAWAEGPPTREFQGEREAGLYDSQATEAGFLLTWDSHLASLPWMLEG